MATEAIDTPGANPSVGEMQESKRSEGKVQRDIHSLAGALKPSSSATSTPAPGAPATITPGSISPEATQPTHHRCSPHLGARCQHGLTVRPASLRSWIGRPLLTERTNSVVAVRVATPGNADPIAEGYQRRVVDSTPPPPASSGRPPPGAGTFPAAWV